MKDRFYNGFLSGILGGIIPFIFNFAALELGFSTFVWAHYMGLFIMGEKPEGITEMIFFVIMQFAFMGVLGAVFAFIIPYISSKHLILKGIIYGTTIWFILLSIPYLLQLPAVENAPLKSVISSLIAVILWGTALSLILKKLDSRIKIK